jgi:hypothetical protein
MPMPEVIIGKPEEVRQEPVLQKMVSDVSMQDEEHKGPAADSSKCGYCGNAISPKDEQEQNVGMFMETGCFHTFHISCFKNYAVKESLKYKKAGQEIVFAEPKCCHCNLIVPTAELRMVFGPQAYEEQVESKRMDIYLKA